MATRKSTNQSHVLSNSQICGVIMLSIGALTLLIIGIHEAVCKSPNKADDSSLVSVGFFMVMLGMAFFFPQMLKSAATDTTSTMRVAIYMIVSIFVFLCAKIGWTCASFTDFKLDSTWGYVIGIALGSKAAQTFAENKNPATAADTNSGANTGPSPNNTNPGAPVHSPSSINTPALSTPPSYITKK